MKLLQAVIMIGLISASSAYDFYVGGRDGWTQSPSESYSQWAQRMRFQVHDKLVFKYKKGADSVLVVKKEDYDSCSTSNPIKKMEDGDSVFGIDRSGPFYFISGGDGNCAKGQKLVVVVLAERNKKPTPTPSPSSPPAPSASAPSPTSTEPPSSPSPSPLTEPPTPNSPSPSIESPSPSTEPPTSPSPSPSPLIESRSPSPSPSPSTESPILSPSTALPSAPSPYSPTTPPSPSPTKVPSPNLPSVGVPPSSQAPPVPSPPGNNKSSASVATASSLSLGALLLLVAAVMT